MPVGPGKYDAECTAVRVAARAQGCILIIFGGERGSGFEVQLPGEGLSDLPKLLREIADLIEKDAHEVQGQTDQS